MYIEPQHQAVLIQPGLPTVTAECSLLLSQGIALDIQHAWRAQRRAQGEQIILVFIFDSILGRVGISPEFGIVTQVLSPALSPDCATVTVRLSASNKYCEFCLCTVWGVLRWVGCICDLSGHEAPARAITLGLFFAHQSFCFLRLQTPQSQEESFACPWEDDAARMVYLAQPSIPLLILLSGGS